MEDLVKTVIWTEWDCGPSWDCGWGLELTWGIDGLLDFGTIAFCLTMFLFTDLYPVMMAPLLMGCSQVTLALVPPLLAWALGSLGLSGGPAPEITSRGADQAP